MPELLEIGKKLIEEIKKYKETVNFLLMIALLRKKNSI